MRYQPTSASAAPCRSFILLFLETRIVCRDALSSCEGALELVPESLLKIWWGILQPSGSYVGTNLPTLIQCVVALVDRPFRERREIPRRNRPLAIRRHHQIKAYKPERRCVAGFHSGFVYPFLSRRSKLLKTRARNCGVEL